MVTRNFIKMINSVLGSSSYSGKDINNADASQCRNDISSYIKEFTTSSVATSSGTLSIGSGTTLPSINDYKLENMIDIRPKMINFLLDANGYTLITATFTNETEETLSVSEVGLFHITKGNSMSSPVYIVLLAREVFNTINLAPGETITVTMRLF